MFKTIRNAFKVPDIRKRLLFTFVILVIVRIGSQLPIPGCKQRLFFRVVQPSGRSIKLL